MIVSFFPNGKFDNQPQPREVDWETFATQALGSSAPHPGPKDRLPAFSPAEFIPHTTRSNQNVVQVHLLVLDLDNNTPESLGPILDRLEAYQAIIYTSWSHTPAKPKLRAVLNLSRPVPNDDWPAFWTQAIQGLGLPVPTDTQCRNSSRLYYGPWYPQDQPPRPAPLRFHGTPFPVPTFIGTAPQIQAQQITVTQLQELGTRWQRSKNEPTRIRGQALTAIARGEPFAEPGERDNTLFILCRELAKAWEGQPLDTQSLARLFAPSIQVMAWPEATQEFVQAKLDRAFRDAPLSQAHNQLIKEAWATGRATPYTPEELALFGDMRNRWIIECETSYYLFSPRGYGRPYGQVAAGAAVHRDLAPAVTAGVQLFKMTQNGDMVAYPLTELVRKYGAVANQTQICLYATKHHYISETKTFVEAPTPLLPLAPTFDPEVNTWLQLLSGQRYTDLCHWLALVPDLRQPLPALVLIGPPGVGKSLLANALAQLWGSEPCELDQAFSAFNDGLVKSPVVFGDEGIPKDFRGFSRTEELRRFLGSHARPLKRKFLPDATLIGCPRLVLAGNNPDILGFNQDLSQDDIAAISERFLHIPCQPEARSYLESIDAQSLVKTQRMASHVLWLWLFGGFEVQGRFGLQTDASNMITTLTVKGGVRSLLCQWLCAYLQRPQLVPDTDLIRIHKGQLLVNAKVFVTGANWSNYIATEGVPRLAQITRALPTLASHRTHLGDVHYRVIDIDKLRSWAVETDMVSDQAITRALGIDSPEKPIMPNNVRAIR